MKKIIYIFFFFIFICHLYSQSEWYYLTFSFWDPNVFINERTNFLSDEYILIKTENRQTENFRLIEGRGFEEFLLMYSDNYIDTTVIIEFIDVVGECVDTMKLIFKPFEMKNRFYVIENVYVKVAFQSGVFNINFPESLVKWQSVKSELQYMPKKFKEKYIYQKNIADFQDWYFIGVQRNEEFLDSYDKRYKTFDQHISFRIFDSLWNIIKPGNIYYSISWTFTIEWDQVLNLNWLETGLKYDSINNCYTITYHGEMWERDRVILFVKGKQSDMEISFRPRELIYKKCSTAEVFIDSIKYKPGKYEVNIPNKVYWNDIKTIHFEGYDKDFFDLTPFQKWRD